MLIMTTEELISSFTSSLDILREWNEMSFNFWCDELFTLNDEWNWQSLTISNLKLIQDDVMDSTANLMLG
jgi:hypothetical protein